MQFEANPLTHEEESRLLREQVEMQKAREAEEEKRKAAEEEKRNVEEYWAEVERGKKRQKRIEDWMRSQPRRAGVTELPRDFDLDGPG